MIINLVLVYSKVLTDGGLHNVSTFLVLDPRFYKNILENVLNQMIEDENPVIASTIIEIHDHYTSTPESADFFNDIKNFVTLYDKENLREKDEDDIVNFFDRNRKLIVDIMMGIQKHLNQFLMIETHERI